jgi:multimeric flavodoxin WrbA
MDRMKKVCLLNGSLRGRDSSSLQFLNRVSANMGADDFQINRLTVPAGLNGHSSTETLTVMADADALVVAFPLFYYTLPGVLTRLLEDFGHYLQNGGRRNKRMKVYAIVNCGFPEPRINEEAIRVMKNFCARLGLGYGFSIAIGSGAVTVMTMKVPFLNLRLKRAFRRMVDDMKSDTTEPREDVFIPPAIPKMIILRIKDRFEERSKRVVDSHSSGGAPERGRPRTIAEMYQSERIAEHPAGRIHLTS